MTAGEAGAHASPVSWSVSVMRKRRTLRDYNETGLYYRAELRSLVRRERPMTGTGSVGRQESVPRA